MRILVTGGAGFIGSHFVRLLAARGDEAVVLDKLTYSGNRANLEGVPHEFHEGDIADAVAVGHAGEGCDAVVNFAAETHVDRSILSGAEFIETDVLGTYVLLRWARDHGARLVQVSTDEVYGDVEPPDRCAERRAAPSVEPVFGLEGRWRHAGARCRPHARRRRVHHARREHVRPEPVPREDHPALRHERLRRARAAGLRRRAPGARVAARRGSRRGRRPRPARGPGGRGLQRRRRGAREPRRHAAHRRADRLRPRARPARRRPSRPRPALRHRRRKAPRARLGAGAFVRRGPCRRRSSGTGRTAAGGSRSSPASTASTTSSSTPLA